MKNKDRMQFNLKNWEKRGFFGNFWDKNDKRATFKKILNKDKYKKKWGDKMKLIELYGIKIKELTEILKDETVKNFEIKESMNYIDYFCISFELDFKKRIELNIAITEVKGNYQSRNLSIEEIERQFDNKFKELKEYLESKNKGELKELEDKISECESELEKMREQYDKINNYGEDL